MALPHQVRMHDCSRFVLLKLEHCVCGAHRGCSLSDDQSAGRSGHHDGRHSGQSGHAGRARSDVPVCLAHGLRCVHLQS